MLLLNVYFCAVDKDSVHAGLLIFKPIKMPVQNVPTGGNLASSQSTASTQQVIGQRPSQQLSGAFNPTDFKTSPQQGYGFQKQFPAGFQANAQSEEYLPYLSPGYQAQNFGYQTPNLGYPLNVGSAEQVAGQSYNNGLQNFDFQQPANSQELGQQLQAAISAGQQLQQPSFSQESYNSDQPDLTSGTDERIAQPSYKHASLAVNPKRSVPAGPSLAERLSAAAAQSKSPVITSYGDDGEAAKTKKRSAPLPPSHADAIVPLKYHDDTTAEDQARLKHTVQRFFSMLQTQRCKYLLTII